MTHRLRLAAAAALLAAPLAAQERAPVSLDATLGAGYGLGGGERVERAGVALDATLGLRVRALAAGSLVLALAGSAQRSPVGGDECVVTPTSGGCVPEFPAFAALGALGGVERGDPRGSNVRLLAGPALHWMDGGGRAFGVQGRVDLATGTRLRLAPLLSLRAALIPRARGETYVLAAAGVGLRLH